MIDPLDSSVAARFLAVLESRIAPALERIADALENASRSQDGPADARSLAVSEVRRAIREGAWKLAASLLADLELQFPDSAEREPLAEELAEASRETAIDRRARLDAARSANDASAVLSYRDELADLLDPSVLATLDRDVLAWVMGLLMKKMRAGSVNVDVVSLAARVAESFAHRPEGASLRASLPTLRRSAGLCARCAEPYNGDEDVCPKCTAASPRIADLPEPTGPSA
jgi:hypothetical protein